MTLRLSDTLLAGIQVVVGVLVIGLAVVAGYQNYQGDTCNDAFATLAASNETRINNVQSRLDQVRTREAALQARTKVLNAPAKDTK